MAFADKYMGALAASNLLDDELHHKTEPLQAAALADRSARHIGALLHRVKYAGNLAGGPGIVLSAFRNEIENEPCLKESPRIGE